MPPFFCVLPAAVFHGSIVACPDEHVAIHSSVRYLFGRACPDERVAIHSSIWYLFGRVSLTCAVVQVGAGKSRAGMPEFLVASTGIEFAGLCSWPMYTARKSGVIT